MKLFIVVIAFTMTSQTFAQTFGVKAGLNLSEMLVKDNNGNYSDQRKMRPGFNIGATTEFQMTQMFSIETGLLFSTKGYNMNLEDNSMGITRKIKGHVNLSYIEIPLTAKASLDVGSVRVFSALGPYFGIGLNGKYQTETTTTGVTTTDKFNIKFGSGDGSFYKRFDYGLSFGAGVEINAIQIRLSYCLGLANLTTTTNDNTKEKNRVLAISMGCKFHK